MLQQIIIFLLVFMESQYISLEETIYFEVIQNTLLEIISVFS